MMSEIAWLQQSYGSALALRVMSASMDESRKSPASVLGLTGVCMSGLSALVFVLHRSLNETEWLALMIFAILGLCMTGIAAWSRSLWWLAGTMFSILLIIGLIGAVAG
jgi:hypothetical protein